MPQPAASRVFRACPARFHRPVPEAWLACRIDAQSRPQKYRKWSVSERRRLCWRHKAHQDIRYHREVRDDGGRDREWDFDLANVMKPRSRVEPLDVPLRQTEPQAKVDRYSRHQEAVLIGSFVMKANGLKPAR